MTRPQILLVIGAALAIITAASPPVSAGDRANGIVHPGDGTHTFVFQAEHRGQWGDIEWHTTNVAEIPYFYYTSGNTRPVLSWESRAGISVGESVCQYGRASNAQDCSLDVFDVSIACTLSGVWNDRLVQMNGITSIPGDSGGP